MDGDDAPGEKYQPEVRVRPGAIVPLGRAVQNTGEESFDPLTLLVNLDAHGSAEGTLYEDAGDGYEYRSGGFSLTTFRAELASDRTITLRAVSHRGARTHQPRAAVARVLTARGSVDGQGRENDQVQIKLPN